MAPLPAPDRVPLPTVGALVSRPDGQVLIVRTVKWSGTWGVPGGKVDWGETLETALRREFMEEVGLELTAIRFALVQEAVLDPLFFREAHFILVNYFAQTASDTVRPNEEIADWAWVPPRRAFDYPLNGYTRLLVETWLALEATNP